MTEEQINEMVTRFLGWKLPNDFAPDAGISFKQTHNSPHWPVGTNLLNAEQAKAMIKHMLGQEVEAPEKKDEFWGEDGIGSSMSGMAVI